MKILPFIMGLVCVLLQHYTGKTEVPEWSDLKGKLAKQE